MGSTVRHCKTPQVGTGIGSHLPSCKVNFQDVRDVQLAALQRSKPSKTRAMRQEVSDDWRL